MIPRRATWIACLLLVAVYGCAQPPDPDELTKANLQQIAKAYLMELTYYQRPPRDMDALRSLIEDLHKLDMGAPVDEAIVSPRDQQPFVIILGADTSDAGESILAYEQKGTNGTRWVVTLGGTVKNLPDEEFSKATFAKQHKPT